MRNTLLLLLLLAGNFIFGQDTSSFKPKYHTVSSFGIEFGNVTLDGNSNYFQSLHGVRFNKSFGVTAGVCYITDPNYKFLPAIISIRKTPRNGRGFGYNFDLGYNFPIDVEEYSSSFQRTDVKLSKGGLYFNPQISGLLYDGSVVVYMNLGYRMYNFTEEYTYVDWRGNTLEAKDAINAGLINIGITLEIK